MKLLSSFKKELILATRSFYFYIELGFALVILAVLLFAIPENTQNIETQYIYLDLPQQIATALTDEMLENDLDGQTEVATVEAAGGQTFEAERILTDEQDYYLLDNEDAVRTLADTQRHLGAVIMLQDDQLHYRYYLQGYESTRLKNLISIMFNLSTDTLEARYDAQDVGQLTTDFETLNDKENTLPPMLAFNSALMGMFIMASYIFLDKKEGVIKAYAVTASSVSRYLMSKAFVVMLTSLVSALIVVLPVMGSAVNYPLLILLLLTSGFFASVLGLLIASLYQDIEKAFGLIFFLMILMMVPGIAYFIPGWDPVWIRILPSYPMIQGFRECIMSGGDAVYVLLASAGFLIVGYILFVITNLRFKRTLSV